MRTPLSSFSTCSSILHTAVVSLPNSIKQRLAGFEDFVLMLVIFSIDNPLNIASASSISLLSEGMITESVPLGLRSLLEW